MGTITGINEGWPHPLHGGVGAPGSCADGAGVRDQRRVAAAVTQGVWQPQAGGVRGVSVYPILTEMIDDAEQSFLLEAVGAVLPKLPDAARQFLRHVELAGQVGVLEAVRLLGLESPKRLAVILGTIRQESAAVGLLVPFESIVMLPGAGHGYQWRGWSRASARDRVSPPPTGAGR